MSDSKTVRFSLRLSPQEDQALQQLATAWQIERSWVVRRLIQRHAQALIPFSPIGIFTPVGIVPQSALHLGGSHETE